MKDPDDIHTQELPLPTVPVPIVGTSVGVWGDYGITFDHDIYILWLRSDKDGYAYEIERDDDFDLLKGYAESQLSDG